MTQRKTKAAAALEYIMLIVIILGAAIVSRDYVSRAIFGKWKTSMDSFSSGRQYDPAKTMECLYDPATGIWYDTQCAQAIICDPSDQACLFDRINNCSPPCVGDCVVPVAGGWGLFSEWSDCSNCSQLHTRMCNNPAPSCGGADCAGGPEAAIESRECGRVDGTWVWGRWSVCSNCSQSNTQICIPPSCGGADCPGSPATQSRACGRVEGGWGDWTEWSPCENCTQAHFRTCDNPPPACDGPFCPGGPDADRESRACGRVAGGWSWGPCSVACGPGTQTGACDNPPPACGGADCPGPNTQSCDNPCPSGQICFNNQCCAPESDGAFCSRHWIQCGQASGTDNCGQPRTVAECGPCPAHQYCSSGICVNWCPNTACDHGENCSTCPADCVCPADQYCSSGTCVNWCPNAACDNGETHESCPLDCPLPPCSCSGWADAGCGRASGCAFGEMSQTRSCTPPGCEVESRCVMDSCGDWVDAGCGNCSCPDEALCQVRECTFGCLPEHQCEFNTCGDWVDAGCGACDCGFGSMCQRRECICWPIVERCVMDSCGDWVDVGCGADGCAEDQMYRTRSCTYGCLPESRCAWLQDRCGFN